MWHQLSHKTVVNAGKPFFFMQSCKAVDHSFTNSTDKTASTDLHPYLNKRLPPKEKKEQLAFFFYCTSSDNAKPHISERITEAAAGPSVGSRKGKQTHKEEPKSGCLAWTSAASISGHLKSCNSGCCPQRLNALWNNQLPPRLMFTGARWSCNEALKLLTWLNSRGNEPASLHDRTKCILSETDSAGSKNTTKTRRTVYAPALTNLIFTFRISRFTTKIRDNNKIKAVMW